MSFVYPWFLWALTALSVPIIIHLFNFRRYKKVYFTNVRFLKELQIESKSKSRLKEFLILLLRCLTIACLVLAFAQPVILNERTDNSPEKAISIYLDNSFSTENVSKLGPVFQLEKVKCKEIIKAFSNSCKFHLITNDFEGKHQRLLTKQDALNAIDEIKVSSATKKLSSVIERQTAFLKNNSLRSNKIYCLSDAQKSTFNLQDCDLDTAISITFLPLEVNTVNNVYIDSCWFGTPVQQKGQILHLFARIVNNSGSSIEAGSVKLYINKQQVALSSYSAMPNESREVDFKFECKNDGLNFGSLRIEDYPITFDDELFFSFNSKINVRVLLINGRSQASTNPFTQLFNSDALFQFQSFNEQTIDYGFFKTSDIIVLNQLEEITSGLQSEILKFVKQGGSIFIVPSSKLNVINFNRMLSQLNLPLLSDLDTARSRMKEIDFQMPFYNGVFDKKDERMNVPMVLSHYSLLKSNRTDFESVLKLQNGDDFLGVSSSEGGECYLMSSALDNNASNFGKHALFVPSVYIMCLNSLKQSPLYFKVSSNEAISIKQNIQQKEKPALIKALESTIETIPESRLINNQLTLFTQNQITKPGFYQIFQNDSIIAPLAFNYARVESNLDCYASNEIKAIIERKGWKNASVMDSNENNLTQTLLENEQGKHLWKLFIFLALLFVVLEILLLRLLK